MKNQYDFGVIGNCSYIAYIDTKASIRWMCMPRFDSSFLFGNLLDEENGGYFYVTPATDEYESRQYYYKNTNVLCTDFVCADGSSFRVTDFAPRFYQYERYFRPLMLFRKVEILSGRPHVRIGCSPVYDYGKRKPEVVMGSSHIGYLNMDSPVRLTTNASLQWIADEQPFLLTETVYLAFTYGNPLEASLAETAEDFLHKTINYWQNWIKTTSIGKLYQHQIIRSALVLKLHQYEDTGGIIAAGTTSLPEADQSGRTWDYRYCWLRDAYYTLTAFNHIGHFEELDRYMHYIENIIREDMGHIQPLYTITGQKDIHEKTLDHLAGYKNNQPVRIGNQAYEHIQNDVYGQVLTSLLPLYIDNRFTTKEKSRDISLVRYLVRKIEEKLYQQDAGIWEFRHIANVHCYTLLFHWVGMKAAQKIAVSYNDEELNGKTTALIEKISEAIEQCYNPDIKAYAHAIGSTAMDASTLHLITMNYLKPGSDRANDHLLAIERELKYGDSLLYRYRFTDDFGKPESTFLVCAFWYVEALVCNNQLDKAKEVLEDLMQKCNHLGLFSEDIGIDGSQWGNFPQTYSHVGLMNAVYRLERKLDQQLFE